jgi:hypothetical protein
MTFALEDGGDFGNVPEDCVAWTESGDGTVTCTDHADLMTGGPGAGFGGGFPAFFGLFFVLAVVLAIGGTVWRVSTARRMARDSGMNVGDATAMALMDEDGLSATYLASNLRAGATSAPPAGATAAERLRELAGLLDQGLITQTEHDERRARIIEGL